AAGGSCGPDPHRYGPAPEGHPCTSRLGDVGPIRPPKGPPQNRGAGVDAVARSRGARSRLGGFLWKEPFGPGRIGGLEPVASPRAGVSAPCPTAPRSSCSPKTPVGTLAVVVTRYVPVAAAAGPVGVVANRGPSSASLTGARMLVS